MAVFLRLFLLGAVSLLLTAAGQLSLLGAGAGAGATYVGPGDLGPAATAWYGLRAYSAAVAAPGTTKAINIRRASDNATTDVVLLSNGDLDVASATTFCAATTCFVTKWYDQTAGGACAGSCDLVQATAGNQPAFIFNCINTSFPCVQTTAATVTVVSAGNTTPATGVVSLSAVANRAVGTGLCTVIRQASTNNRMRASSANNWTIGGFNAAANDTVWHAANGDINGASAVLMIDGSDTTGTSTGTTTAGTIQIAGIASTTCNEVEAGFYDNAALSTPQRTALNGNQRAYWNF